jgi:hypothetical protein
MSLNVEQFNPTVAALVKDAKTNALGPAKPEVALRDTLAGLTPEALVAPRPLVSRSMAQACLAGLWLRYDFLDESHRISQEIDNPTGSFWHGIMHRREGDFGNAKYWFRRVGEHPIFDELAAAAAPLAADSPPTDAARFLIDGKTWNPFKFVDLCESASGKSPSLAPLCMAIQEREWELLFAFCHRQAVGG